MWLEKLRGIERPGLDSLVESDQKTLKVMLFSWARSKGDAPIPLSGKTGSKQQVAV